MNPNLSSCASLVKNNDYYRYICGLFAPQHLREYLFTLYAFNHEIAKIKDIASEPMIGMIRLAWWREALDEIYSGVRVRQHEVTLPLQDLITKTTLPRYFLDRIIDARDAELSLSTPENIKELNQYIEGTSTNLLLASLYILGIKDNHAEDIAKHTGTAYALIGIMRSTKWNASKMHILFPKEMLIKNNIREDDIIEGRNLEKLKPVVEQLCDNAQININKVKELRKNLPKAALPVYLHSTIADFFLKQIRKNNYDLFNSDSEKGRVKLLTKIFWDAFTSRYLAT